MRDGKVPKRQYTDEFKIEAIRLSDSVGGHAGEHIPGEVPGWGTPDQAAVRICAKSLMWPQMARAPRIM